MTGEAADIANGANQTHRDRLRTALAINRCMEFLDKLGVEAQKTTEQDSDKRADYLFGLLLRSHSNIYHDWQHQVDADSTGYIHNAVKRSLVRGAIDTFLSSKGKGNGRLFDSNGFVVAYEPKALAELLAKFYDSMRAAKPFTYGSSTTLDMFMTALGRMPAFRAVYPNGIDLRRLDDNDRAALHNAEQGAEALQKAFLHSLDPLQTPSLNNKPNGYGEWPNSEEKILGIPFLSYQPEGGPKCLVTVNGGLVPLDVIRKTLEDQIVSGLHVATYPPITDEQIVGYVPGTEKLRDLGITQIDGFLVSGKAAPLFCLDINIMTGLREQDHKAVEDLLNDYSGGKKTDILTLANNESLKRGLIAFTKDDRLQRSVAIAFDHLSVMKAKIDTLGNTIFANKRPAEHPQLFMSMGGPGSGKTSVETIAQSHCNDNFVTSSLDEFRKSSDLYTVLTKAMHHGDDYGVINPFALTMRNEVAERAKRAKVNLLYDGTGIVYQGRYDVLAKGFEKAGFDVNVTAIDLPLPTAIERFMERYRKPDGRAMPWIGMVGKHIRAPSSFMQAVEDRTLKKVSLFDSSGEKGKNYLVAESFTLNDKELAVLEKHQKGGTLAGHFKQMIAMRGDSVLRQLAKKEKEETVETLTARTPNFDDGNVAYLVYAQPGENRVLAIYNSARFQAFMEKGMLNPHASGTDGLETPADLPVKLWQERLQQPSGVAISGL